MEHRPREGVIVGLHSHDELLASESVSSDHSEEVAQLVSLLIRVSFNHPVMSVVGDVFFRHYRDKLGREFCKHPCSAGICLPLQRSTLIVQEDPAEGVSPILVGKVVHQLEALANTEDREMLSVNVFLILGIIKYFLMCLVEGSWFAT